MKIPEAVWVSFHLDSGGFAPLASSLSRRLFRVWIERPFNEPNDGPLRYRYTMIWLNVLWVFGVSLNLRWEDTVRA